MALRNEEVTRLKYELGYNVTGVGAEVYITYTAVFDRAVQPYLIDTATTSSTTVTAVDGGALATIILAANPSSNAAQVSVQPLSFVEGSNIVVDVGAVRETSVIQSISGLTIGCYLALAHSGTYTVKVQGAEQIIRDCFDRLDRIKNEMLNVGPITAGISALVGEVEFFSSGRNNRKGGRSKFEELIFQRTIARRDLADALGVTYLGDMKNTNSSSFEVY